MTRTFSNYDRSGRRHTHARTHKREKGKLPVRFVHHCGWWCLFLSPLQVGPLLLLLLLLLLLPHLKLLSRRSPLGPVAAAAAAAAAARTVLRCACRLSYCGTCAAAELEELLLATGMCVFSK